MFRYLCFWISKIGLIFMITSCISNTGLIDAKVLRVQGGGWALDHPGLSRLCKEPTLTALSLILVLDTFQFCSKSTLLQFSDDRHIFELIWSEVKGFH